MAIDCEGAPARLTPAMVSRRLQVLDFVRRYIARWGGSPSYGEIAAACGISRNRAHKLVRALVHHGLIGKVPGERGLRLVPGDAAGNGGAMTIRPHPAPLWIEYVAMDVPKQDSDPGHGDPGDAAD